MSAFDWTNIYTSGFFTPAHLVQIAVMVCVLVGAGFLFFKRKDLENKMYIFLAVGTIGLTGVALLYSIITKTYNLEWYIPLHICNLLMIVAVIQCIFKKKVRTFLNEYTFYCGLFGCFIGIIIPASTLYYFEAFSFISTVIWLYHLVIGITAVYLLVSGVHKIKFYNSWKAFALLIPLCLGALIANHYLNTNFIGLNPDKPIFGLELIAKITGEYYAATLVIAVVSLGVVLTTVSLILNYYKKKLVSSLLKNNFVVDWLKKVLEINEFKSFLDAVKNHERIFKIYEHYREMVFNSEIYTKIEKSGFIDAMHALTLEDAVSASYWLGLIGKTKVVWHIMPLFSVKNIKNAINEICRIAQEEVNFLAEGKKALPKPAFAAAI